MAASALADVVAAHKSIVFHDSTPDGKPIDYREAVTGHLNLVPHGNARKMLADDYRHMLDDGLLLDDAEGLRVKPEHCVAACAALPDDDEKNPVIDSLKTTLRLLARRWNALHDELRELDKQLTRLTKPAAPRLLGLFGVGPQTAATLLVTAGDNPTRLRNESALAALCGVSPLEASSGKTSRHRLNRGGQRQANNALWTIAMVRMRSDARTRDYVVRRTKEGLSKKNQTIKRPRSD